MKYSLLLIVLACVAAASMRAQGLIYPGEELTYRVSYMGITLGSIKTLVEPWTTLNGKKSAKVKVFIESSPNIPFVSLNSVYESWMDESATFSYKFNANTRIDDNTWEFDQYLFDYDEGVITAEKYRNRQKVKTLEFRSKKRFNDGSSILFAARRLVTSKKTYRIPSLIMDDTVSTVCNFLARPENIKLDAAGYSVKCLYFNGEANWTGIYGLTGRFEGWFSDDEARIPIRAYMKVYVGSVTLELQSWKRGTWQPPRAE
jgi:hypothetical protein